MGFAFELVGFGPKLVGFRLKLVGFAFELVGFGPKLVGLKTKQWLANRRGCNPKRNILKEVRTDGHKIVWPNEVDFCRMYCMQ